MARASSVILTPAEKKLAVNNAKDSAKAAKAKHAGLTKDRAALDKAHAAKLKELEKTHKAAVAEATKAYTTAAKESDKALKAAAIALTKADADVLKLVPTVAPTTKLAATADAVAEKAVPTETA
jgi:hypothetical protein